ncbi:MAG: S-layer homology domain-containing protein, partial [Firmicutes bacterium]|nr:S-layer homology domain-containing protein [Bacillota bacterium]
TRAEFATIVVRGLGLPQRSEKIFDDVAEGDWFYGYAAAAFRAGIVKGVSATRLNPQGTITRQEALTMVARAALQAKAAKPISEKEAEDALAALPDGGQISDWARDSVALCLKTGLTEAKPDGTIVPLETVRRSEIAGIIYNLYFSIN